MRCDRPRHPLTDAMQAERRSSGTGATFYKLINDGCPEETYLKAEEARPQHAQGGSRHRTAEVSPLPGDEASTPRV